MREKELLYKFGNPVIEKCRSGWCVPDPRWYNKHLVQLGFADHDLVTNKITYGKLWKVESLCVRANVDLDWIKEITSWVPRCKNLNPQRSLSLHAWGLAVDINWSENPYGAPNQTIPQEFISIMEDVGFVYGGNWKVPDPHHFQVNVEEL